MPESKGKGKYMLQPSKDQAFIRGEPKTDFTPIQP